MYLFISLFYQSQYNVTSSFTYNTIFIHMNKKVKLDNQKDRVAEIHGLSHDGRGIATVDHKTTFIDGALPQEKVTFQLSRKRSHYNEGHVVSIIESATDRTSPICPHFGICGGCSLQHMSTSQQLSLKQQTLLEQLKHFGRVEPKEILPPLSANTAGYRRKARLGVKFVIKKNKLLVGFREKASRYLADLDYCAVLHPQVGMQLNKLSQLIYSLQCYQDIPQIEVAVGDEEVALIFRHMQTMSFEDQQKLKLFGEQNKFQIYLQPNPPLPITKVWPEDHHQRLTYTLPDEGLTYLFHPLDFTQINLEINRLMVKQARTALQLESNDNVLDLFCGIGNFTLPISRYAKHVTGIEGNSEMITRATVNALHNNLANINFFVDNLMETHLQSNWIKKQYHKILIDPPRAGAKEILPYFPGFNAKLIVYVSCNPATLARDAGILVHEYGYQLKQAGIMNMFPHTSHIEAMAIFEK